LVGPTEFEYRGELSWHKLVDKMIRMGFEQEPEFDKMCGSPSYQSEEVSDGFTLTLDSNMNLTPTSNPNTNSNPFSYKDEECEDDSKFSGTPEGQVFVEFTEPTTIVILGDSPENYSTSIQITDDETCFSLFVGGKRTHDYLGSMGFADVFTLEEYKKYYEENKETLDETGLIGGVVVPNFVGKVLVTAFVEDGDFKFSNQFNLNTYIQHQFEDHVEVGIILPDGTQVLDLNEDCSLPVSVIRDIKIDTIIK
jgi:hypothetical protein